AKGHPVLHQPERPRRTCAQPPMPCAGPLRPAFRGVPAMSAAAHLDQVWQSSDDPFGYRTRWYEQRKRELLLAVLPWPGFGRGWEIGCANGELTHALAGRCKALLGTDLHPRAVAAARARCSALAHVEVRQMEHPREWPDDHFDLVVVGEVGYYLDAPSLAR